MNTDLHKSPMKAATAPRSANSQEPPPIPPRANQKEPKVTIVDAHLLVRLLYSEICGLDSHHGTTNISANNGNLM